MTEYERGFAAGVEAAVKWHEREAAKWNESAAMAHGYADGVRACRETATVHEACARMLRDLRAPSPVTNPREPIITITHTLSCISLHPPAGMPYMCDCGGAQRAGLRGHGALSSAKEAPKCSHLRRERRHETLDLCLTCHALIVRAPASDAAPCTTCGLPMNDPNHSGSPPACPGPDAATGGRCEALDRPTDPYDATATGKRCDLPSGHEGAHEHLRPDGRRIVWPHRAPVAPVVPRACAECVDANGADPLNCPACHGTGRSPSTGGDM